MALITWFHWISCAGEWKTTEKTELCEQVVLAENRVYVLIPEGTLKGQGQMRNLAFQTSWYELLKLPARKLDPMYLNLWTFRRLKLTYGVDWLRGKRWEAYLVSALEVQVMSASSLTYCSDMVLAQSSFAHSNMGPCDGWPLPLPICYFPTYIV